MLSQNNIRSINVEAFAQPLPKLTTLRVESNEIVYADVTPLSAKFPVLQKASISPNPWSCACFQDVRRWLKDKNVNYTTPDYNYFSGNRPVCVLLNEISRQTYT